MALPDSTNHSFIVRVWLEETAEEAQVARWRGQITHVPSQKRRYVEDLRDLNEFIAGYLQAMGVRISPGKGSGMSSFLSFFRGRTGAIGAEATAELPEAPVVSAATAVTMPIYHGIPSQVDVLAAMRTALSLYLPSPSASLPQPNVTIVKVEDKPTGLGNHIGQERLNQFPLALKAGRLQVVVRFQLWGTAPNDVDEAIDLLHGRLLDAKEALYLAGFLRFSALDSSLAEHATPLDAWRRTADYEALYEFRYTDSNDAQSLIARIPIHADPEEPASPQRETTVVTDEMARWDDVTALALTVHGRRTIRQLSALRFVPGTAPAGPVMLLRTFTGATGTPTAFPDLAQWVTAVAHPTAPNRHAQVTFATFSDFLSNFSATGDTVTLGDWDEDTTPDEYHSLRLDFATPIPLPDRREQLQLIYQPGNTDPHFDQTAVFYIRAV